VSRVATETPIRPVQPTGARSETLASAESVKTPDGRNSVGYTWEEVALTDGWTVWI